MELEAVELIFLTRDRIQCRIFVNTMTFPDRQMGKFLNR